MENLFLAKPDKKYQKSFEQYVLSCKAINDKEYYDKYKQALEDFDGYVNILNLSFTEITELYDVVTSTFWLIHENDVVGVVRVRHEEVETAGHIGYDISPMFRKRGFGSEILKLALIEAKKIGIKDAIVTCNVDNVYSRKIIEKNNGKLLGTVYDPEEDEHLYEFSIPLKTI